MKRMTHVDTEGRAKMVNVGDKEVTRRSAKASVVVRLDAEAFETLSENRVAKGNVLAAARLAGIQGAKKTSELIPLCHQIPLDGVEIEFELNQSDCSLQILATARCTGRTGVELEALTACSVAALTVYDMLKAVQKDIAIDKLTLLEKTGGRSGDYRRPGA